MTRPARASAAGTRHFKAAQRRNVWNELVLLITKTPAASGSLGLFRPIQLRRESKCESKTSIPISLPWRHSMEIIRPIA
jgi:hypothetical protein